MPIPVLEANDTLVEVRTKAGDAARHLISLRSTPADKRGADFAEEVRQAAEFVNHADLVERSLMAEERGARAQAESESQGSKSQRAHLDAERRTMGEQVVDNEGFDAWAQGTRSAPFTIEVRNLIGGFATGAYESGTQGFIPVATPQMSAGSQQRRRAFVRDLMTVQSTGLRNIPYIREEAQITNETGAQMTSEASAKPEVTLTFEQYNAVVEKIAAWLPVTDEIMSDAPTLMGYINTRLDYMLMIREEQQVLAGTGTSPQIQGLATLSGTQTQATVSGGGTGNAGDFAMTIGRAFGKIENVDGDPDGVVCNPVDFWAAVTSRHANQFDYGFSAGAPGAVGNVTWGERVVRTRAMTTGSAWAAAWALGSTLFDRQQTTIKVGDQHSDFFIRNIKVVLAEKRIAVAWHRPNLFVLCTVPQG